MKELVATMLDTRKMTTTGENAGRFHVKIGVTFRRMVEGKKVWVPKRFKTYVYATPDEFAKIMSQNNRIATELIRKRHILAEKKQKAVDLAKIPSISPEQFEMLMNCEGNLQSIETVSKIVIAELEEEDRIGTADSYGQAVVSVKKNGGVVFADITVPWLRKYERVMTSPVEIPGKKKGDVIIKPAGSISTVGIYLRALRRMFKKAIQLRLIPPDIYPFGEGLYVIPAGKQKKKALKSGEKDVVLKYSSDNEVARYGADFWIFSYFCNGMNPADIAHLKMSAIDGNGFSFVRQKTKATNREQVRINVHLRPEAREIIARRGNKSLDPNAYIFPILEAGLTAKQVKNRIKDFRKDVNAGLKIVSHDLKLPFVLKFGYARHTSSTILKNKGVSTKVIGELLGHGSEKTTEIYLGSIEPDELERISGEL